MANFNQKEAEQNIVAEYKAMINRYRIHILAMYQGHKIELEFETPPKRHEITDFLSAISLYKDELVQQLYITLLAELEDDTKYIRYKKGGIVTDISDYYQLYYEKNGKFIKVNADFTFFTKTIEIYDIFRITEETLEEVKK